MTPQVNRVLDGPFTLGEGPHWDSSKQCLYFVDIYGKTIHKYVPSTKKHTKATIGEQTSLIIPVEGQPNKFLISIKRELAIITWDGQSDKVTNTEKICEVDNTPATLTNAVNDGKCDSSGRLWAGTVGATDMKVNPKNACFFNLEPNNQAKIHLTGIGCSNGLAWNKEGNKFYYIDTFKFQVEQYDFDIKTATISNCQVIFTPKKHNIDAFCDGMTIDTDGNLWIALFNGYQVIKIDPRKPETLLDTIKLPAKQVTSVAFGGKNLDELYVTTAALTVDGVELKSPEHGALYVINGTGSRGYPAVNFKLN